MPFLVFRRGSFARLRSTSGIICSPDWGHFRSGDHLRRCAVLLFLKTITTPYGISSIYTMIITTYCVNITGLHCALSFRRFSSSLSPIFLSFSAPYYPASSCTFSFFLVVPLQVLHLLPFAHLSLTSHSSTPVHYEIQLRPTPQKHHSYFTRLVNIPERLHYNKLFHLFRHVSCCTKTCIAFF